jgi:hypothetical protein
VEVDNAGTPQDVIAFNIQGQSGNTKGMLTLLGQQGANGQDRLIDPVVENQNGIVHGIVFGEIDQARKSFVPEPVLFTNEHPGGTLGGTLVTDPLGGTAAARLTTSTNVWNPTRTYLTGDYVVFGGWIKSPDGQFLNDTPVQMNWNTTICPFANLSMYNFQYIHPSQKVSPTGWYWIYGWIKITGAGGACNFTLTYEADATHRQDVYGSVINYIPASYGWSDFSVIDYVNNLKSYDPSCAINSTCGMAMNTLVTIGPGSNAAKKPSATDGIMYVATGGNDSYDGTSWGSAKLTGQAAENALPANGGTIKFAAGSYAGAITISKPTRIDCAQPNGTASTTLTIPNAVNTSVITITSTGTLAMDKCVIDGNRANQASNSYLIASSVAVGNLFLTDNVFENGLLGGINFTAGASDAYITGNTFSNNGTAGATVFDVHIDTGTSGTSWVHIEENLFDSNGGCISLTSQNGAMIGMFENYIASNTCDPNAGATAATTTGIQIVGNTTANQSSEMFITNNSFRNFASALANQYYITVSNIYDSEITNNILLGRGAMTVPGVLVTSSSGNSITRNNFDSFNGTGDGGASIKIVDSLSANNSIGLNQITTTSTTPIIDNGTGTLMAQWINGDLYAASILTNALKLNGSSFPFLASAGATPPAISSPSVGGIYVVGPQNLPMGYNVNATAWQNFATWCTTAPTAGHLATVGSNYPCIADGGTTAPPSGAASGDLSGTYPSPTVAQVNGAAVPASQSCVGTNSARQIVSATCGGGITGPGSSTVGNAATWNNTTGGALADAGGPPALVGVNQIHFDNFLCGGAKAEGLASGMWYTDLPGSSNLLQNANADKNHPCGLTLSTGTTADGASDANPAALFGPLYCGGFNSTTPTACPSGGVEVGNPLPNLSTIIFDSWFVAMPTAIGGGTPTTVLIQIGYGDWNNNGSCTPTGSGCGSNAGIWVRYNKAAGDTNVMGQTCTLAFVCTTTSLGVAPVQGQWLVIHIFSTVVGTIQMGACSVAAPSYCTPASNQSFSTNLPPAGEMAYFQIGNNNTAIDREMVVERWEYSQAIQ